MGTAPILAFDRPQLLPYSGFEHPLPRAGSPARYFQEQDTERFDSIDREVISRRKLSSSVGLKVNNVETV